MLALLSGSLALVVIAVIGFSLIAPSAIAAQDVLKKRAGISIVDGQSPAPEFIASTNNSLSDNTDPQDSLNDDGQLESPLSVNPDYQVPETYVAAPTDQNGSTGTTGNSNQRKATQSPTSNSNPSQGATNSSSAGNNGSSQQNPVSGTSNTNKPESSVNNEYYLERNGLHSAASELSKHISQLQSVANGSGIMNTSYHPSTSFRDTARKYIVTANKALDYTNNFSYDYKTSGKYSDLSNYYNEIANANKHVASAANLIKNYCEKFLSCPNPQTHYSCFTDYIKGHQVVERTSQNTLAYKMDHIENALKAWKKLAEM